MDTRRRSMSTAQALMRRRQPRRGHFYSTKAERPYSPSREALSFKPNDVSISVGDA